MRKGFTLIELLVVIVIIGVLAAVAIPQYLQSVEKGRATEALNNVPIIRGALDRFLVARRGFAGTNYYTGCPTDIVANLDTRLPLAQQGVAGSGIYTTRYFRYIFNANCTVEVNRMDTPTAASTGTNTQYRFTFYPTGDPRGTTGTNIDRIVCIDFQDTASAQDSFCRVLGIQ